MIRKLAAVDTTDTDDSDLGGITFCRATHTSFQFGDYVTVNTSLVTTELGDVLLFRLIAQM